MCLYLGKKLNLENYIEVLNMKLIKFSGITYQLDKIVNRQQLYQVYQTYVTLVVRNGVLLYGLTLKSNLDKTDLNVLTRVLNFKKDFDSVRFLRKSFKNIMKKSFIYTSS